MLFKRATFIFLTVILLLSTFTSFAAIAVNPDIINFLPNQEPAQNVLVANDGQKTAYVDVTPFVVEHPGTKKEKEVRVYNPNKSGFLVTPSRLIIPAGQQRYVRVMLTKPVVKDDRIYRVNIVPKIAGINIKQSIKGREVGVHLIVGYGILVIARPNHMQPILKFKREGNDLNITNVGNTNIFVTGGKQCPSHKGKCFQLPAKRMYAGNHFRIKLPYKTKVTVKTKWLDNSKTYTVN